MFRVSVCQYKWTSVQRVRGFRPFHSMCCVIRVWCTKPSCLSLAQQLSSSKLPEPPSRLSPHPPTGSVQSRCFPIVQGKRLDHHSPEVKTLPDERYVKFQSTESPLFFFVKMFGQGNFLHRRDREGKQLSLNQIEY